MRNALADQALALATQNPKIVLLSGDIGNRLFDRHKSQFPDRFFNCGVAEANMTGMAAGMALAGLRPITYTIAAFNTYRCFEQIRLDLCYQNLAVTVVGVGAGLSYATLGYSHHAPEDIGALRLLPNMTVLCPADPLEARGALCAAIAHDGPVYIRIGKKGEPAVHDEVPEFAIGRAIPMREGADVCLIGVGTILPEVLGAATLLAEANIDARVVSFPSVKPLDEPFLDAAFENYPLVAVIEEHSRLGGAGAAVAEYRTDRIASDAALLRIAMPDAVIHEIGSQVELRRRLGLDAPAIAERVRRALQNRAA